MDFGILLGISATDEQEDYSPPPPTHTQDKIKSLARERGEMT
jgi:hypothetical protein